jgi:hypothetical protein
MGVVGYGLVPPDGNTLDRAFACRWSNGVGEIIQTPAAFRNSYAYDVNGQDLIVGFCDDYPANGSMAFIASDEDVVDLTSRLPSGSSVNPYMAVALNDTGQVLCAASWPGLAGSALLTPVIILESDLDSNCRVDIDDLLEVINHWGQRNVPADISEDGVVNIDDLLILISEWGVYP